MNAMRLKLIACDVLMRELCLLIAKSPHIFDVDFTEKNSHNYPDNLRESIQDKIDHCVGKNYDAVLLGYGLCGNSTTALESRDTRIVIPRAHDCCTLFLGSKEEFERHFKDNPSQPFSSPGYIERSDSPFHDALLRGDMESDPVYLGYVAKWGEENAKYIYETMYGTKTKNKKLIYIEIPETRNPDYSKLCRKRAEESGMEWVPLVGSLELLRSLLDGNWEEESFLILNPGQRSRGAYDWEEIIRAEEVEEERKTGSD